MAECAWQTKVLLPKGVGELRGIGISKVLWKALSELLNHQIRVAVKFHDVIHRFRAGRVADIASLEANLLQQLMVMMGEVLYEVFLDLRK